LLEKSASEETLRDCHRGLGDSHQLRYRRDTRKAQSSGKLLQ